MSMGLGVKSVYGHGGVSQLTSQYLGGNRNKAREFARADNFNVRTLLRRSNLPTAESQSQVRATGPSSSYSLPDAGASKRLTVKESRGDTEMQVHEDVSIYKGDASRGELVPGTKMATASSCLGKRKNKVTKPGKKPLDDGMDGNQSLVGLGGSIVRSPPIVKKKLAMHAQDADGPLEDGEAYRTVFKVETAVGRKEQPLSGTTALSPRHRASTKISSPSGKRAAPSPGRRQPANVASRRPLTSMP